ncbi:MAG: hypothetical protein ABI598_03995, partial [Chloroflexota bacterium]
MPFRPTFDCLWCGTRHETRSTNDLEGWAQLCPSCVGRAGDNEFLKFRLRRALDERGSASRLATSTAADPGDPADRDLGDPEAGDIDAAQLRAYYDARAPEYDDWYLRRGRYARGPADDEAWASELEAAGDWVDALPIGGQILEIATGTGWWSPRLARRGALTATDAV